MTSYRSCVLASCMLKSSQIVISCGVGYGGIWSIALQWHPTASVLCFVSTSDVSDRMRETLRPPSLAFSALTLMVGALGARLVHENHVPLIENRTDEGK